MVETDELQRSLLRFGDGVNGRLLPDDAIVRCDYQAGYGAAGNVGAGTITSFEPLPAPLAGAVLEVWNPFDVVDGRDPEPVEKVLRSAPEAYRARQLRAVTLDDYRTRAEEVPGVSRAVARYAWTGSWRTVRLVIDPAGHRGARAVPAARSVAAHLEAVRLIGEDMEIRPPRFVPLEHRADDLHLTRRLAGGRALRAGAGALRRLDARRPPGLLPPRPLDASGSRCTAARSRDGCRRWPAWTTSSPWR